MNHRDRLKQVRALRDRLERLPPSPERDRILADVRSRVVDLESGNRTAPMRPIVDENVEPPKPARAPAPKPSPPRVRPAPKPQPQQVRQAPSFVTVVSDRSAPLPEGVLLNFDDEPAPTEPGGTH